MAVAGVAGLRRAWAWAALASVIVALPAAAQPMPLPTPRPGASAPHPQAGPPPPAPAPAPVVPPVPAAPERARPAALLRGLDKFSGRVTPLDVDIGATVTFQRLQVTVRACSATAEGAAAYLKIVDTAHPGDVAFAGWMFAANPALSALDHPRYDVWLIACMTASGDAS